MTKMNESVFGKSENGNGDNNDKDNDKFPFSSLFLFFGNWRWFSFISFSNHDGVVKNCAAYCLNM